MSLSVPVDNQRQAGDPTSMHMARPPCCLTTLTHPRLVMQMHAIVLPVQNISKL